MRRIIIGSALIVLAPAALAVGLTHTVLVLATDVTEALMRAYERAGRWI